MARRDSDFLGLEVISLDEASVVGRVDGLLVADHLGKVQALVVGLGIHEAKAVPLSEVVSLGDDAVTVRSASAVKSISAVPEVDALGRRGVRLRDELVLTDSGNVVGRVGDYFVDTRTGDIRGFQLLPEDRKKRSPSRTIHSKDIVRIGPELVIVRSGAELTDAGAGEAL